ncbi:hypothetical protein A2U01_0112439, partial [Trifolium medium]|nr:hypothetical protein [Trifolium medium]
MGENLPATIAGMMPLLSMTVAVAVQPV